MSPVTLGVMLAAGEGANDPGSAPPADQAVASGAVRPPGGPTPEHVREVQQALVNAGYDPGPIDGIFGPRTKSALLKYIAVPAPHVPGAVDQVIVRFGANELIEGP